MKTCRCPQSRYAVSKYVGSVGSYSGKIKIMQRGK